MLKAERWPRHRDVPGWLADAADFRSEARRRCTLSMKQRIEVAVLYDDALAALPWALDDDTPPLPGRSH
jgi:hypothetical protein